MSICPKCNTRPCACVRKSLTRPTAHRSPALVSAPELLKKAEAHMTDRASTYDHPQGERSMAKTVSIFNQFHGTSLLESQGWHLLQILKEVRELQRQGYHADSAEDEIAYAALKSEAKQKEGAK